VIEDESFLPLAPSLALFFYTGALGSSALAPLLYGWLGDVAGPFWATTALAVVPLMFLLSKRLALSSAPLTIDESK
jgi:hypothetical protein